MDYTMTIQDFYASHIPEVILLIGGALALFIVYMYKKDQSSGKYKVLMALGVIFGVVMIGLTLSKYASWGIFTSLVIVLMGFTMVIRPFREVHFAVILGLVVIFIAYLLLGRCADIEGLELLGSGWPRVIIAFVAGAVVYMIASFAEKIVMLFGKLFNWWPFMVLLAIICMAEALCLLFTGNSIYQYFVDSDVIANSRYW
jgi:hypothetical protein